MSVNDGNRNDNREQEDRIDELKERAEQAAGGRMTAWESGTLSSDERKQFWARVVDYETASSTTHLQQLAEAGVDMPEPDSMDVNSWLRSYGR
jgi:hypothetical protein